MKLYNYLNYLIIALSCVILACQYPRLNYNLTKEKLKPSGEPSTSMKIADHQKDSQEVVADHPAIVGNVKPASSASFYESVGLTKVYKADDFSAVIYQTGLNIDADGSPFAYHPEPDSNKGLDYLADAGHPGNWWGIVTLDGQPIIQGARDPAPGFYVSTTSLMNSDYFVTDSRRYVNASEIPFIVLPLKHDNFGGRLGDVGAVVNFNNGKVAYVIAADEGPANKLGEGSVALAKVLGVNPNARNGGVSSGIGYCFFPNSGDGKPKTLQEINQLGAKLFSQFGGAKTLKELLNSDNN